MLQFLKFYQRKEHNYVYDMEICLYATKTSLKSNSCYLVLDLFVKASR